MSHKGIVFLTTSLLLLTTPSALADTTPEQSAASLGNEPFESKAFVIGTDALQSNSTTVDQTDNAVDGFQITNQNLGVQFTRGQYYGNKGPASEEQGIQIFFSSQ